MNEQVRIDGNIVEIDGRWRMELPGGVRARSEETEDDVKFSLYIDRREIASCELGRTEEDRQASAILYMASAKLLSTVYGREMNTLLETDVRNDERMHVRLTLKMDTGGGSSYLNFALRRRHGARFIYCSNLRAPLMMPNRCCKSSRTITAAR